VSPDLDWGLVGLAAAAAGAVMLAGWLVQLRRGNAGIVDIIWAWLTGLIACALVLAMAPPQLERATLLIAMIAAWALRLGTHLARRVLGEAEDGRYQAMKRALGRYEQPGMFVFFQVQALWAVMFALPVVAAALAPRAAPDLLDALGLLVFAGAWAGENLADRQLARFRRRPDSRGRVCDIGLWRYSRHPNYFFEWLHWFAYPLIGWGAPAWWLCAAGPVVMLVFLYYVTGIPFTEQQAIRSRGEAYRRYQRTTSAFIPLPPRTPEDPEP